METYHAGGNRELCDDCPLRRFAQTWVPYGDTIAPMWEAYCAEDKDPEECKEEEE